MRSSSWPNLSPCSDECLDIPAAGCTLIVMRFLDRVSMWHAEGTTPSYPSIRLFAGQEATQAKPNQEVALD